MVIVNLNDLLERMSKEKLSELDKLQLKYVHSSTVKYFNLDYLWDIETMKSVLQAQMFHIFGAMYNNSVPFTYETDVISYMDDILQVQVMVFKGWDDREAYLSARDGLRNNVMDNFNKKNKKNEN